MIWNDWIHGYTRVGKKRKRVKGPDAANKLPGVTPHTKVDKNSLDFLVLIHRIQSPIPRCIETFDL